jgi:gamma-glutamylcyclotransferase (GGCT)/AIG2-like uncharacterized protein YtfP
MSQLPMFVYGTLRRGESNHHFLEGTYERVLPAMLPDYMKGTASHGYPLVSPQSGSHVDGELFFIRSELYDATLERCDRLEDLPPGRLVGDYYQRRVVIVRTEAGMYSAWAYTSPDGGRLTRPERR